MKQATKGAFLSGLVYPGTGQLYLGRMFSGLACMSLVTIGLGVLIYRIGMRIYLSMEQMLQMRANNILNYQKLIDLLNHAGYTSWDVELISFIVVVCCWIASIVHAYYLGKNADRLEDQNDLNHSHRDRKKPPVTRR